MFVFCCRFLDPLVFGDYPETVKKNAGTRIPAFTTPESKQVKGSFDFIAINHYFATYIKDNPEKLKIDQRDFALDVGTDMICMSPAVLYLNLLDSSTVLKCFQFDLNSIDLKQTA